MGHGLDRALAGTVGEALLDADLTGNGAEVDDGAVGCEEQRGNAAMSGTEVKTRVEALTRMMRVEVRLPGEVRVMSPTRPIPALLTRISRVGIELKAWAMDAASR